MGGILLIVLLLGALAVAGGVVFALALSRKGQERMTAQHELIPGVATAAPREWGGAHSPEAKMHRRLRDAIAGLRAQAGSPGEDVELLELRVEVEQQAIAVDHRLIAAAALPPTVRGQALAEVEQAVAAIEQAAGAVAAEIAATGIGGDDRSLAELNDRVRAAADSRALLESLEWDATAPDTTAPDATATDATATDPDEGGQPQAGTA